MEDLQKIIDQDDIEMDMSPMIDMVFLLLIWQGLGGGFTANARVRTRPP